jgi:hypothetical protein
MRMTSLTNEPAPHIRPLLIPFLCLVFAIYVFFVALSMEVYLLLIPAAVLFGTGVAPAMKLVARRH